MNRLLVRGARQLLTLRGPTSPRRGNQLKELAVIEDGALLAENGQIVEAGPTRRLEHLVTARNARVIDASGCIVLPGFVDASADILPFARLGHRSLTRTRLVEEAQRKVPFLARQGTTSAYARVASTKDVRVIEALGAVAAHFIPGVVEPDADLLPDFLPLVRFVETICGADGLDVRQQLLVSAAKRLGYSLRVTGPGALHVALSAGASVIENPDLRKRAEVEQMAGSAALVVLTPVSARGLLLDPKLARRLIDAGAALVFGTGLEASPPRTTSLALVLAWAVHQMGLTAEEAITTATANASHALGVSRTVGTLEAGKSADFVVMDCPDYRELASSPGINLVSMVVKKGRIVHQEPPWEVR